MHDPENLDDLVAEIQASSDNVDFASNARSAEPPGADVPKLEWNIRYVTVSRPGSSETTRYRLCSLVHEQPESE